MIGKREGSNCGKSVVVSLRLRVREWGEERGSWGREERVKASWGCVNWEGRGGGGEKVRPAKGGGRKGKERQFRIL